MSNDYWGLIYYLNMNVTCVENIKNIIQQKLKKNADFNSLLTSEQIDVAKYVYNKKVKPQKIVGKSWFDVLTKRFYTERLEIIGSNPPKLEVCRDEFNSFDELYLFLDGNIYNECCFFGYEFSDEEIHKFKIDISKINFDSFINESPVLKDYSFEYVKSIKELKKRPLVERAISMQKWISKCKIDNVVSLLRKKATFERNFSLWEANKIFISSMIDKYGDSIKEYIVQIFCKLGGYEGVSFSDILMVYGVETAIYVADNYVGQVSLSTRKAHQREFRNIIKQYNESSPVVKKRGFFDNDIYLYYVVEYLLDKKSKTVICQRKKYCLSFDDFVTCLGGDLSEADLSDCPTPREIILQYKTTNSTKLPPKNTDIKHLISKRYVSGHFEVEHKWVNSDHDLVQSCCVSFDKIFDFVHYLQKDLSEADLLMCEGLENLGSVSGIVLKDAKIRSKVADALGILQKTVDREFLPTTFETTKRYELQTTSFLLTERFEEYGYLNSVSYITDIHLLHRFHAFHCKTYNDEEYVTRTIAKSIVEQSGRITLIGGDVASDFDVYKKFITQLKDSGHMFFTLGNHEFWPFSGQSIESIVAKYRLCLDLRGMHLVHNNLYYFNEDNCLEEITSEEMGAIDVPELRNKTRKARLIIFGGVGFSRLNTEFNANNGIYRNSLNRKEEEEEGLRFYLLYKKVAEALYDKNVIVFTHMPIKDWNKDGKTVNGFVYVNGHNHKNYFYDDGATRIYADNQVGYTGTKVSLKRILVNYGFDWFIDYKEGIHEISREDYSMFYRGINEGISFSRDFNKLLMIKRDKTYMFLVEGQNSSLYVLNGGVMKNAGDHDVEYFYKHLGNYSRSIKMFLSKYDDFQQRVSKEIKEIGGDGYIHGCIVDIDFYNHLYLNPLDGSITPYYARSMVDKYVYKNIASLLKYQCPDIFNNYQHLLSDHKEQNQLISIGNDLKTTQKSQYVDSTEMYKVSRIVKGLQFATKHSVVRIWNDSFIENPSEESGRAIVSNILLLTNDK